MGRAWGWRKVKEAGVGGCYLWAQRGMRRASCLLRNLTEEMRLILAVLQSLTLLGGKISLYRLRSVALFHMHAGVLYEELLSKQPGVKVSRPALMGMGGAHLGLPWESRENSLCCRWNV